MIPNDEPARGQVIKYMLDNLDQHWDELNDWEQQFVESLLERFARKQQFSDRQCEKLEDLHDRF